MPILSRKFYLYYITSLIIVKVYAVTFLPGASTLRGYINIIDSSLLFAYFIFAIELKDLLLKNFKLNVSLFFLLITLIFFLYSSLYVNISYNLNFFDIFKILNYIFHFIIFFIYFPRIIELKSDYFEDFLKGVLIFVLINSFFSLLSLHTGFNQYRSLRTSVGLFMSPNSTAFIYTIGIPILFHKYWDKKIIAIAFIPLLLILFYCEIFTLSRGGYVGLLVSLMVLFYTKSKKLFIITISVLSLLLFIFFYEIIALKTDSSLARGIIIYTAINMATKSLHYFLWGYGVTRATDVLYDEKQLFGNFEVNVNNPHNFLLLLLIQFGFLLTISYLIFLISVIINSVKLSQQKLQPFVKKRINLLIAIISGLIVQNLFEEIIIVPDFPLFSITLIILGLLYHSYIYKENLLDEKRI